ncbi:hypothetical protein PTE_02251 [Photorhabdus khanii NC19]|uniref:Uncharacterized protein n=1 Tax=Photorhabdus khanii NC19 TaxID=1004151 RepID=W3V6Z7_9GAMM|nr:hypothetical protein PTE_02251 [Photorhabdus khanii NC19]
MKDIVCLNSTSFAFTALRADRSVVAWGGRNDEDTKAYGEYD